MVDVSIEQSYTYIYLEKLKKLEIWWEYKCHIQWINRSSTTGLCVPMSVAPKSKIDKVIRIEKTH